MCSVFCRLNLVGWRAPFPRTGCVRLRQRVQETVGEKKTKQHKDLVKCPSGFVSIHNNIYVSHSVYLNYSTLWLQLVLHCRQ
jgi:hypothetical protein